MAHPYYIGSLCTGAGGLELGLERAIGACRPVFYVEREAYAVENLASKIEQGAVGVAPIWTDLATFDAQPFRGLVDILTAGYPCQPFSVAGKRRGAADERHLWPHVARIVDECRPSWCFFENVPGHLRLGFDVVHADLRRMGYRVAAGLFTAAEVGAPHKRERLFILANNNGGQLRLESGRCGWAGGQGSTEPRYAREAVADDDDDDGREGLGRGRLLDGERPTLRDDVDGCGGVASAMGHHHHHHPGLEGRVVCGVGRTYECAPWPPGPENALGWQEYLARWPGLEPAVLRGSDGLADRVDRLRLCGNGVVPDQAARAFRELSEALAGGIGDD